MDNCGVARPSWLWGRQASSLSFGLAGETPACPAGKMPALL
jgi:hypothetical protein